VTTLITAAKGDYVFDIIIFFHTFDLETLRTQIKKLYFWFLPTRQLPKAVSMLMIVLSLINLFILRTCILLFVLILQGDFDADQSQAAMVKRCPE